MTTVLDAPATRDYFTLDGKRSPGVCSIESGGEFKVEVTDQRQPLTQGAATVVRGIMNAVTTYKLTLWTDPDLAAYDRMEAQLIEGARRTPKPRVWKLVDLRYRWVAQVIIESISPEKVDKPGGPWIRSLVFHQYGRLKPVGGPLKPPDAIDAAIVVATAEVKDLSKALSGAIAASKADRAARRTP